MNVNSKSAQQDGEHPGWYTGWQTGGGDDGASTEQAPVLNVVRGNPSDEELAALTAVVLGLTAPSESPAQGRTKARTRSWVRRRQLRLQPAPGPGAWRRSGR